LKGELIVMMKYFQKLGKALMLPVAVLPAAAILMGIGYLIDPNVMAANADKAPIAVAVFLVKEEPSSIICRSCLLWVSLLE
jgi:PTS system N-acetylglucosamine-specific IIC component